MVETVGKLVVVLSVLAGSTFAQSRTDRVDELFREWDGRDRPGCSLGVIEDGQFVYQRSYGMANLEHDVPLSSTSVFRMASVSKQFAAFAMFLAEQQGKLSLDDDVRKYLPELPRSEPPITIRHLLHHTSGLRDYLSLMSLAGVADDAFYTEKDVIDILSRQEGTNFAPGAEYLYSNTGYFLLSQILPRATGLSLREFARKFIFEPLGMEATHFHDNYREVVKNRADGYRPADHGRYEVDMTTLNMVGDGGLYTTVDDLLVWDRNFYTGEVGGEALRAARLEPGTLHDGTQQEYAAGLRIFRYRGLDTVSHGGSFVGFRTAMLQFPSERFSVYLLCNVSAAQPTRLALAIADIYLEEALDPAPEPMTTAGDRDLARWTGLHWNEETGAFAELVLQQGGLYWKEEERALVPIADGRFAAIDEDSEGEVELDGWEPGATMTARLPGQRVFTYERLGPVSTSPSELSRYVGDYRCRELDVTYRVELEGGALQLTTPLSASTMTMVFPDGFRWDRGSVVFHRDRDGDVRSFELAAGRARNFLFEKP